MPRAWLLLLVLFLQPVRAADIGLIRVGENWRFLRGINDPLTNSVSWRGIDFDDSAWPEDRAGFSNPGNFPETSVLRDYGINYTTIYFRKNFQVADLANIADLILRIDYDDGFVAYLNGEEVARRGVPGEHNQPVPATVQGLYHARGLTEEIRLTNSVPLLRAGTNILAVQIIGSSLFDYTVCFVSELLANVTRGPFVQNTTVSSTQIIWKTLTGADSAIEFGTNQNSLQRIEVGVAETNHVATITGLESDTRYVYRILNQFGAKETVSDWQSFRTFKRSGSFSFQVVGDSGWASTAQFALADQMERSPDDFVMHVGDLIYYAITHQNSDLRCFSIYEKQMRDKPWFLAIGNHDLYVDRQAALQSFYLPTNSVTGTEHYYSFDHGDAHFVVVWSDLQAGSDYAPGSPQYAWVDNDLAQTQKPWKFMFFHHTWRTSSVHQRDDYDYDKVLDSIELENALAGLARKHGVQIVFNGHDHCYERLAPSGGPISFVSGGGGSSLYPMTGLHPDSSQFYSAYHFLRVDVGDEETLVEAIGLDGSVFDKVHVRRTFPERRVHAAEWHTPLIELQPSNDQDGNILGQTFDFLGEPLNGPMGQFTSAGRLFVNNDETNIYLGLDEVMLRAGEELFLFIESPALNGRSSLGDLGDGIAGPGSEGADGLDFMANLSFQNFAPSVGVVLGDEWGDAWSRDFLRAGQEISTGQGAFYLTNHFPEVPGQRMVQFNRSPQLSSAVYEQNTDYAELAIPYSSLGGLRPGDKIKIGVVTGLRSINTNMTSQTRHLDTSGIGYSVSQVEGITILEGVEVRLASDPDPDHDGLTTEQELALGTNPNNPDSDADGLPDGWELTHSLNPLNSTGTDGGNGDPDKDTLSNVFEFRAGTNPKDPQSRLGLGPVQVDENKVRLIWSTIPGKRYKLQSHDSIAEAFRDVEHPSLPRLAQGPWESLELEFSGDLPGRSRYYRVQLVE